MPKPVKKIVVQRKNDPFIYLYVMGEWYCYNPQDSLVGSGAMGDVYKGYRCNNGAPVAIKRVKDCYANNRMIRERARQEASLAFRHSNLVEMRGCCEYAPDHGPIFLVSNFVQGENIDDYVKHFANTPNRVEKICTAISSVLDALDYVHSRGVIHRDIKPSNIMVENDSNVRLMDLGISRMNGGNKFSLSGFIGTPQYSAPEQIKRDFGDGQTSINATTDFYALGITLYELLAGKNPMDCDSDAATLEAQLSKPLPADPAIPRKLMQVIWKATEKDQTKRYQTALDFKQAIANALLLDPSFSEKVSLWTSQHALAITISIISLLVIGISVALILTL